MLARKIPEEFFVSTEKCLMHYIHVCGSALRKIAQVIKRSTLAISFLNKSSRQVALFVARREETTCRSALKGAV